MAANPIKTFPKDPDELLDFTMDWGDWLAGDVIDSVLWAVPVGIANSGVVNSASTATIWLSGGTAGTNYDLTCTVTTVGLRTAQRTMRIAAQDR